MSTTSTHRKPVNLSLDSDLVREAKAIGLNVSRACESGLAAEVKKQKEARWREENQSAIESWNDWVREHGLPLDEFRQF